MNKWNDLANNTTIWVADDDDDVFTVEEFLSYVKGGMLTDYDGLGHPITHGAIDINLKIYPSDTSKIPEEAEQIIWFNK